MMRVRPTRADAIRPAKPGASERSDLRFGIGACPRDIAESASAISWDRVTQADAAARSTSATNSLGW